MKKNIKYAGVAAATLLMIAPLTAPVFSTASTAKADDTSSAPTTTTSDDQSSDNGSTTTDSSTLDAATQASLNRVFGTIQSTVTPTSTPDFSDVAKAYGTTNLTNSTTAGTGLFGLTSISSALSSDPLSTDTAALDKAGVTYGVQGVRDGTALTSASDFNLYIKDAKTSAITLRITAYKGDTAVGTKDVTFEPVKQATSISSVALKYTDPYEVALGSSTSDPQYSTTVDATATDQDGNTIKVSDPTPGAIYSSKDDAYSGDTTKAITADTFTTDGATYYQPVTVTLDPSANLDQIFSDYESGKGGGITLNGTNAIKSNVNGGSSYTQPAQGQPATAQTLTYVREIKVSSTAASNWTVTPIKGVVTVGGSIAALCDDNGQPSTGRSLAANTPWLTDEKRVNNTTGAVQYRVSTHEWVAAEDVSYSDGQTPAGLTDITDLEGRHVVNLDGPSGFVYSLYDSTGKLASRGLAGATSWLTDKTAKDSDGTTYYRVSTDEWIKAGNGVNFE